MKILVINPGGTSTKIAVFEDEKQLFKTNITHTAEDLKPFHKVFDQFAYYTPYFSNVLGVSLAGTGAIAIIRQYGTRFIGAPVGGWLGDRIHSVSKVVGVSLAAAVVIVLVFMFVPVGTSAAVLTALTLCAGVLTYMARGCMFAVPSELQIPRKYAGTTSGVVCAIGYCPDLFIFVLFGYWLDKHGNAGYQNIFIYAAVIMAIGVVNAIITQIYKKKVLGKESAQNAA